MSELHPDQPVVIAPDGVIRFKQNAIVRFLLDNSGIDMNEIARRCFSDDDANQFAQLIGYSVSGYGDLSYADPKRVERADKLAERLSESKPLSQIEEYAKNTFAKACSRARSSLTTNAGDAKPGMPLSAILAILDPAQRPAVNEAEWTDDNGVVWASVPRNTTYAHLKRITELEAKLQWFRYEAPLTVVERFNEAVQNGEFQSD